MNNRMPSRIYRTFSTAMCALLLYSSAPAGINHILRTVAMEASEFIAPDYTDEPNGLPSMANPQVQPTSRGDFYSQSDLADIQLADSIESGTIPPLDPPTFSPDAPEDTGDNLALIGRPEPMSKSTTATAPGVPLPPDPIVPPPTTSGSTTGSTTSSTSGTTTSSTSGGTTGTTSSGSTGTTGGVIGTPPPSGPGDAFPWEGDRGAGGSEMAPGVVNTQTGNRLVSVPIVGWKGKGGVPIHLTLYNNSQDAGDVGIGEKWRTSVDFKLTYVGTTSNPSSQKITAYYPNGRRLIFARNMNVPNPDLSNAFYPPTGFYDIIYRSSTGYTLRTKDQFVYSFNSSGQLVGYRDRYGNNVAVTRSGSGSVTYVILSDQAGRSIQLKYMIAGSIGSTDKLRLAQITAPGNRVWNITYKSSVLPGSTMRTIGTITYPPLNTAANTRPVEEFFYDNFAKMVKERDAVGRDWTFEYDSQSRLKLFKTPLIVTYIGAPGDAGGAVNQTYTLNYFGSSTEYVGPLGNKLTDYYDGGTLRAVKDEADFVTSYGYDTKYNKIVQTDGRNNTSQYEYDAFGNCTKIKDPRMAAAGAWQGYSYNAINDVTVERDARGVTTTYVRDQITGPVLSVKNGLNQVIASYTYNADGTLSSLASEGSISTLSYDAAGQLVGVSTPEGSATINYGSGNLTGLPISVTDNRGRTSTFNYDSWSRLSGVGRHDGSFVGVSLNTLGWTMSATDTLGRTTTLSRDLLGRVINIVNPRGDSESYTYDWNNRQLSVTNGRGKTRWYAYSPRSEITQITFADGTTEKYKYDGAGNQTQKINGLGQTIQYGYDASHNLTSVVYPDMGATSIAYDLDGRQTSVVDPTGTSSWTYNNADKISKLITPQGVMDYTYDQWGRRLTMTEGTAVTTYGYSGQNLTSISKPSDGVATSFAYDQYGRMSTKSDGQTMTEYSYDTLDRVSEIVHKKTSDGSTLHQESYNYNAAGNLTSKIVNSVATSYTYDEIDQLLSEVRTGYNCSYSYDQNGNRSSKNVNGSIETYSYDDADKLLSRGGLTYNYDGAGRTTAIKSGATVLRSFTWNSNDRLTSISSGASSVAYSYNGLGARVAKANSAGTRLYKRDGVEPTAPVLSDGVAEMVPGISEKVGGNTKFFHFDHLGSMKGLSSGGVLTDSAEYDAFGVLISRTGSTNTQKGFAGNAGYQEDAESGYKLLGNRYYDADSGRFLSRDPIQHGTNYYAYVDNNPCGNIDPTGQLPDWLTWKNGLSLGGAIAGGLLGGPAGAAIGAGLGRAVGGLIEGESVGQAVAAGVIDGALTFVGGKIVGYVGKALAPLAKTGMAVFLSKAVGQELKNLIVQAAERVVAAAGKGLSKLGAMLEKHAARAGGGVWGKVVGSAADKNALALKFLKEIIENPKSLWFRTTSQAGNDYWDVWDPVNKRGVRLDSKGNFVTFLNNDPRVK